MSWRFCLIVLVVTVIPVGAQSARSTPPGAVNFLYGSYAGCVNGVGYGCAKGDYRWGSDGTVFPNSRILAALSAHFTSADIGKHGVAVQWNGAAPYYSTRSCTALFNWGCWSGASCEFTVVSVNSPSSIEVAPGSGCGRSGVGFAASANAYWAIYSDDSAALVNAVASAQKSGSSLYVPANYHGGIGLNPSFEVGFSVLCGDGATFYNPHLSPHNESSWIIRMVGGRDYTITGCTFSGTEPTDAAWQDADRNYDVAIAIVGGASDVVFRRNTVENVWGTYAVGTSQASDVTVYGNVFRNCAYYGIQLAETRGSSSVTSNLFTDCNVGSEDSGSWPTGTDEFQVFEANTIGVGPNGGTGYNKTQGALGLGSQGSVFAAIGKACSGRCTNSSQYKGVTFSRNVISGAGSVIYGSPGITRTNGASIHDNSCIGGCSYR